MGTFWGLTSRSRGGIIVLDSTVGLKKELYDTDTALGNRIRIRLSSNRSKLESELKNPPISAGFLIGGNFVDHFFDYVVIITATG